jgi:mannose-6-phosphate isomerase
MPTLDGPLQLSNVFKPKIWGQADLAPLFSARHSRTTANERPRFQSAPREAELIGEVWITDDTSRFLNGPVAGMTLAEASKQYGRELHGNAWNGGRFPILGKYIFTSDWLSVQVHPDDDYARVHDPGNVGKCEMWYILRSEPDAGLLLGLKPNVTKEELEQAFRSGTSRDFLVHYRPETGEAIYVPPGTVHALGPGLVLFEVEENSDLTYRLDDFGRRGLDGKPRPLHLKKGLDVIRLDLPTYRGLPRVELGESYGLRRFVLACRFFALEELTLREQASFKGSPARVEVLSILEGEGRVEYYAGWMSYRTGETWLIPPATTRYRLVPSRSTRVLRFYVPDLDEDFRKLLAKQAVPVERVNRIVFE